MATAKPGRKKNGQFKKGSPAAKRAGKKGGMTTAKKNARCHAKRKSTTKRKTSRTARQRSLFGRR